MTTWLIVIGCILLLFLFLYFIADIQTNAIYYGDSVKVIIYVYKLKILSKKFSIKKDAKKEILEDNDESVFKKIAKIKKYLEEHHEDFKIIARLANRTVTVKTYNVLMDVGVGNSVFTGIAVGGINAIFTAIRAIIDEHITVEENPTVKISPAKGEKKLDITGNVIVKYKISKLVKLARVARKLLKSEE